MFTSMCPVPRFERHCELHVRCRPKQGELSGFLRGLRQTRSQMEIYSWKHKYVRSHVWKATSHFEAEETNIYVYTGDRERQSSGPMYELSQSLL